MGFMLPPEQNAPSQCTAEHRCFAIATLRPRVEAMVLGEFCGTSAPSPELAKYAGVLSLAEEREVPADPCSPGCPRIAMELERTYAASPDE